MQLSFRACSASPQLKEDVFVDKAERVVELVDDAGEHSLLLRLRLLLVARPRRRVGHGDLGRLLRVGQAEAGGQGDRGLRVQGAHKDEVSQ